VDNLSKDDLERFLKQIVGRLARIKLNEMEERRREQERLAEAEKLERLGKEIQRQAQKEIDEQNQKQEFFARLRKVRASAEFAEMGTIHKQLVARCGNNEMKLTKHLEREVFIKVKVTGNIVHFRSLEDNACESDLVRSESEQFKIPQVTAEYDNFNFEQQ